MGKRNLCTYRTWNICVGKLHLAHLKDVSIGDERIQPTDLKNINKATLNSFAKIQALECKANFIDNYFISTGQFKNNFDRFIIS